MLYFRDIIDLIKVKGLPGINISFYFKIDNIYLIDSKAL
jgi:hypothetical protein